MFLDLYQLCVDAVVQGFSGNKRALCGTGSLHIVPYQFVWVKFGCVARQKVQFQFSIRRCDIVLYNLGFVGGQTVENQEQGLLAMTHQHFEHRDKQLRAHSSLIGRKPEAPSGVYRRSRRYGLSLSRYSNNRGLPLCAPTLSLDCIGTEAGFVPEIDVRTPLFCLSCNAWIDVMLPCFNGGRIALVSPPQRLLRRQSELRQQLPDRRHAQIGAELISNQLAHHQSCPQAKIES